MTTTIGGSYPAVNSDSDATINGLTVGIGGGAVVSNTVLGKSNFGGSNTGTSLVAIGQFALNANTSGTDNTVVGWGAGQNVTTGSSNTILGSNAMRLGTVTGSSNTALGVYALAYNTTASYNTAVGYQALYNNTTGTYNTAVGFQAGPNNTTASYNTYIGYQAGQSTTTGIANTIIGGYAGAYLTTGSNNTLVGSGRSGYGSGYLITTGSNNTILGVYSGNQGGLDIRTASNYIVLSDGDGNPRVSIPTGTATATIPNATGTVMVSGNMPAFSAYNSTNQTITMNTVTKVLFNTEDFDTNNNFASSTFTPTVAGYYQINASLDWNITATHDVVLGAYIYKNGAGVKRINMSIKQVGSAAEVGTPLSSVIYMNGSTDYLEIYCYEYDYTASTSAILGAGAYTWFNGALVRTA